MLFSPSPGLLDHKSLVRPVHVLVQPMHVASRRLLGRCRGVARARCRGRPKQSADVVNWDDRDLLALEPRGWQTRHRGHLNLSFVGEPFEQLLEVAVASRGRGGGTGIEQVMDEGLDVLTCDRVHLGGIPRS